MTEDEETELLQPIEMHLFSPRYIYDVSYTASKNIPLIFLCFIFFPCCATVHVISQFFFSR